MTDPCILYIIDGDAVEPLSWPANSKTYVLPMTSDLSKTESAVATINGHLTKPAEVLDYTGKFNRKAWAIRDDYLRLMAELPRRPLLKGSSIHKRFALVGFGTSAWWLTPIAEKNTVATASFARLAALLTIADIRREVGDAEIWLDLGDGDLVRALRTNPSAFGTLRELRVAEKEPHPVAAATKAAARGLAQIGKFIAKAMTVRWVMRGTDPVGGLAAAKYVPVTYFPLIDKEAWAQQRFANKYFGSFQTELEEKHGSETAWLAVFARFDNVGWRQSLDMGRQVNEWGHRLSFLEQWIYPRDLFFVLKKGIAVGVRFARLRPALENEFVWEDDDHTFNIWPLFEDEWYDSFCGAGLVRGLVYHKLFQRVTANLAPATTVLYIAEMLAWEKALNSAAAIRNDLTIIGVQHTIVPLLLLNYFNDPLDLEDPGSVTGMPRPDYLACVGDTTRRLLLESGWEEDRVFVWGALRFEHFRQYLMNRVAWGDRDNKLVVALPISPDQSKEILSFVHHALDKSQDYEVHVKGHPSCPVGPLIAALDLDFSGAVWRVTDTPLSELLPVAKAAVVTESSAALESIACQCPVIVPWLPQSIDLNPLSGLSDLQTRVSNPQEMRQVVDDMIRDRLEAPLRFAACEKFINDYCHFPAPGEYLRQLEKMR